MIANINNSSVIEPLRRKFVPVYIILLKSHLIERPGNNAIMLYTYSFVESGNASFCDIFG